MRASDNTQDQVTKKKTKETFFDWFKEPVVYAWVEFNYEAGVGKVVTGSEEDYLNYLKNYNLC